MSCRPSLTHLPQPQQPVALAYQPEDPQVVFQEQVQVLIEYIIRLVDRDWET